MEKNQKEKKENPKSGEIGSNKLPTPSGRKPSYQKRSADSTDEYLPLPKRKITDSSSNNDKNKK